MWNSIPVCTLWLLHAVVYGWDQVLFKYHVVLMLDWDLPVSQVHTDISGMWKLGQECKPDAHTHTFTHQPIQNANTRYFIYIYIYLFLYICIYIYLYIYLFMCIHIYLFIYTYLFIYINIFIWINISMNKYIVILYIYMQTCMFESRTDPNAATSKVCFTPWNSPSCVSCSNSHGLTTFFN